MYYKEIDYDDYKECFYFLANHETYSTLNPWNGLRSIANNVKLYHLPNIDVSLALEALEEDDYFSINSMIKDWEYDHPGYLVAFNGRSGGYLVLYNNQNNRHVFYDENNSPCQYEGDENGYKGWLEDIEEYYGSLEEFKPILIDEVKIVQEFDKLCDDLYEEVKYLIQELQDRKNHTHKYSATLRFQRYYYDTIEDMQYHMLDMKNRSYSVWECDKEELWAEYEMNESIESEVVVNEEGDEEFIC